MKNSERDAEIRKKLSEGVDYREVAKEYHLTPSRIGQIKLGKSGNKKKTKAVVRRSPTPTLPAHVPTQEDLALSFLAATTAGQALGIIEERARRARVSSAVLAEQVAELLLSASRR